MSLTLGKAFDRSYNIRISYLDGFYNLGIFCNKNSSFLLFSIDADPQIYPSTLAKISMFKNLESSLFCETFLNLHNYRKSNLDISNQFKDIKQGYEGDVSLFLNENISLSRIKIGEKHLYDKISIYGLTFTSYQNEFSFIIAERQFINKKINKKIVRSTAVQLASSTTIKLIDEFKESTKYTEDKSTETIIFGEDK